MPKIEVKQTQGGKMSKHQKYRYDIANSGENVTDEPKDVKCEIGKIARVLGEMIA